MVVSARRCPQGPATDDEQEKYAAARCARRRSRQAARRVARPAAQGRGDLSLRHRAALGGARQERAGGGSGAGRQPADPAPHPARPGDRRAQAGRPPYPRHRRLDHAHAQAAGRPHPHLGAGRGASPRRAHSPDRALPPGAHPAHRGARGEGGRRARVRGAAAKRQGRPRARPAARQEHLAGGHGRRHQSRRSRPARRPRGVEHRAQGRGSAASPRDSAALRTPQAGIGPAPARDPVAHHAAGDLLPGARRDGQQPARVFPAPAAQGDPAGARRGRRAIGRSGGLPPPARREEAARGGAQGGRQAAQAARAQPSRFRRDRYPAHLSRLADRPAVGRSSRPISSSSSGRA